MTLHSRQDLTSADFSLHVTLLPSAVDSQGHHFMLGAISVNPDIPGLSGTFLTKLKAFPYKI